MEAYNPTQEELEQFMIQFQELERQLQIQTHEKNKLEEHIEILQREESIPNKILRLNHKIKNLDERNKKQRSLLEDYEEKIANMQDIHAQTQENLRKISKEKEYYERQLRQEKETSGDFIEEIQGLTREIKEKNKKLEQAKQYFDQLEALINSHTETIKTKDMEIKNLEARLKSAAQQSELPIEQKSIEENNCDGLNKQIRKLTLEKESKMREVGELKELLDSERDKVSELTSRIKEMEDVDVQSKIEIRDSHRQNEIITDILNNQIQFMLELVNNISRLKLKDAESRNLEKKIRKNLRIIQEKMIKSKSKLGGMKKRKKKRKRTRKTRRKSKINKKKTKRK